MIYNIYPTKDATIYDYSASMNTGVDEILEIEKTNTLATSIHKSRALLGFSWGTAETELEALPRWGDKAGSSYHLRLYTAKAKAIPYSYKLEAKHIKVNEPWEMGIGKRAHSPVTTKGVSWGFRDYSGSTAWTTPGGEFYTGVINQTQSFEFESTDVKINISSSITRWAAASSALKTGSICILFSGSQETDSLSYGNLQFFSRDTNTIYSPRIQVGYDDSIWSTGSMDAITSDEILVYLKNNRYEYKDEEVARFEVRSRDIFPAATYATTSAALTNYYLPTGSYYSVKDAETEETVIDFDTSYTKISCTSSGNFFDIAMKALQSERLYKVIMKVENRNYNGQIEYFDSNHIFKVVR